ncbi:hypothetical protein GS429_15895 [Natronorubrum sp. JWXQ-INN-674]|uniref:Uncharacterized protein n=1 Tax=Natronorubrum halalkaliphilum TaxID=2691917 RepID=A0A6B0VNX1_9EURY|nr:hypothetical protein [Natronorubrum halalkaliphilum]MXV63511.1 hypothetical protein [Natronorubrum halalkaliphilum]
MTTNPDPRTATLQSLKQGDQVEFKLLAEHGSHTGRGEVVEREDASAVIDLTNGIRVGYKHYPRLELRHDPGGPLRSPVVAADPESDALVENVVALERTDG